jgi:hypothetical protein
VIPIVLLNDNNICTCIDIDKKLNSFRAQTPNLESGKNPRVSFNFEQKLIFLCENNHDKLIFKDLTYDFQRNILLFNGELGSDYTGEIWNFQDSEIRSDGSIHLNFAGSKPDYADYEFIGQVECSKHQELLFFNFGSKRYKTSLMDDQMFDMRDGKFERILIQVNGSVVFGIVADPDSAAIFIPFFGGRKDNLFYGILLENEREDRPGCRYIVGGLYEERESFDIVHFKITNSYILYKMKDSRKRLHEKSRNKRMPTMNDAGDAISGIFGMQVASGVILDWKDKGTKMDLKDLRPSPNNEELTRAFYYVVSLLKLFACMSYDRNYESIELLQELLPYDLCLKVVKCTGIHMELREAFLMI